MKIAFIGFGEAAHAFVASLKEAGDLSFAAFDILTVNGNDGPLRAAADEFGIKVAASPAEAVQDAEWVISAVTAADSLDAARSVADTIGAGQTFIDINSVSAGRKREAAQLVSAGGAAYLDMAVMAPVHPRGHRTPVLIAGPSCEKSAVRLGALGFDFEVAGPEIGDATSIKMVRSLFVKGLEAITVQALLAAEAAGCLDAVYASLSKSFPQLGWPEFPLYQLERVTRHGIRRAAEMRESAQTMAELELPAGRDLAAAIAGLQQGIGELGFKVGEGEELAAVVEKLLARRRSQSA